MKSSSQASRDHVIHPSCMQCDLVNKAVAKRSENHATHQVQDAHTTSTNTVYGNDVNGSESDCTDQDASSFSDGDGDDASRSQRIYLHASSLSFNASITQLVAHATTPTSLQDTSSNSNVNASSYLPSDSKHHPQRTRCIKSVSQVHISVSSPFIDWLEPGYPSRSVQVIGSPRPYFQ